MMSRDGRPSYEFRFRSYGSARTSGIGREIGRLAAAKSRSVDPDTIRGRYLRPPATPALFLRDQPGQKYSTFTTAAANFKGLRTDSLRETIARSDADLVLIGTPIDLRRLVDFDKPALRVTYKLQELGEPSLADLLAEHGLITGTEATAVA